MTEPIGYTKEGAPVFEGDALSPEEAVAALDAQIDAADTTKYQAENQLRLLRDKRKELAKKCTLVGPFGLDLDFIEVDDKGNYIYAAQFGREVKIVAVRPPNETSFVDRIGIEQEPEFLIRLSSRAHKGYFEQILKELRDRLIQLVPP